MWLRAMMARAGALVLLLGGLVALGSPPARAQQVIKICLPITNSSSGIAVTGCYDVSASNPLPVTLVSGATPQDVNIAKYGGTSTTLGQKTSSASIPVVLASDQASAATPVVSTSGEATHVLKAGAGTLLWAYATNLTASPGFLVIINATSAPGDGAITPLDCAPLPGNGVASINYNVGSAYSTGITAIITSATSCFTKTTGVITGFINGGVR